MLDLSQVPGAFQWADDLPRPQWEVIRKSFEGCTAEADLDAAWSTAARQWLDRLAEALGEPYRVHLFADFIILSPHDDRRVRLIHHRANQSLQSILQLLPDIAVDEGYGPHALLVFAGNDHYYTYVCHYDADGEFAGSGGIFLDDLYGHIALPSGDPWRIWGALTHELAHSLLRHLPLPLWLEEGLVEVVTDAVDAADSIQFDPERRAQHLAYWSEHGLDGFWAGASFRAADDGQELSYNLAHLLVRLLLLDRRSDFLRFVGQADYEDGGEAACQATLGQSLGELAAAVLGEGPWQPRHHRS